MPLLILGGDGQYPQGVPKRLRQDRILMSLSTIVVALNAQLLRRVDLRPAED